MPTRPGEVALIRTHRATLEEGPEFYRIFRDNKDGCVKVVLKP